MSFLDIVSKFNQQADSHSKSQSLNPFSERFEESRSPSPRFSREDYGKPVAGSKTDLRGRKAKSHICREILELCTVIHDVGTYNAKKRTPEDDDDDEEDDGTIIVSFGELFQIYTKISDKVVGLLIAAKRRGFVYFDREILFQRRDDDVLIALLKPISEISKILKDDITQANAPAAPVESAPVEKKKSTSSSKTKRAKPAECNNEQKQRIDNCTTTVDQTNVILEVNGAAVVGVENNEGNDDRETKSDGKTNDGGAAEEIAIDSEGNGHGKANCADGVDGGQAAVQNETGNGKTGGDEVDSRSGEQADGGAVVETKTGDGETVGDNGIRCGEQVDDGAVVETKTGDGEAVGDNEIRSGEQVDGGAVVETKTGDGEAVGDNEIRSGERVDGGADEEIQINGGEAVGDNEIRSGERVDGGADEEIQINGGEAVGDNVIRSGERVDGGADEEIQINGGGNADDEMMKGNDEAAGTVVECEVVNDAGDVSESMAVESIQNTVEDVGRGDEGMIDGEIKAIDMNDLNEIVEDKNENFDSVDVKEAAEIIENVLGEKCVDSDKVNTTNESTKVSSFDGAGNVNGEIEQIIPVSETDSNQI